MLKRFAIVSLIMFSISVISASAEMWKDSFDGNTINDKWGAAVSWSGQPQPTANWEVESGVLTGRWPTYGQQQLLVEYPSPEYAVQVRCRINEIIQRSNDNGVGIIFHSSGPGRTIVNQGAIDFYGFAIGTTPSPGAAAISYVGAGQWGGLAVSAAKSPINVGEWYTLKLVVEGNRFRGYVDDELVCDAQDDRFTGNYVGPYMSLYIDTSFDEFVVTDQMDDLSPSAVDANGKLSATWGHMKTDTNSIK
jgi:hypothetical protein